jgi:hypothetical protein
VPNYNFSKYQSKFKKPERTRKKGRIIEITQKITRVILNNMETSYFTGAIKTELT